MRHKKINCPWFVTYALSHVQNWKYSESAALHSVQSDYLCIFLLKWNKKTAKWKRRRFFYSKMRDAKINSCHVIYWNGDWLTPKCRSETVCVMLYLLVSWKWVRSYYNTQTLMVMKIFIWLSGRMPPFAQLFCNWQFERINYNLSFAKNDANKNYNVHFQSHPVWMCIIHNGS